MRRTAEFDAFGPWVMEVRGPEDVPRLFRDHPLDVGAARLVLKVPRSIERRNANPDMDLYDHLLVLGRSALTVLSRRGEAYDLVEVPYARVAAVHTSVELLDGLLRVYDVAGVPPGGLVVDVRYNGVSHDLISGLTGLLRAEVRAVVGADALRPPRSAPVALALRDLGDGDIALVSTQHELADRDGLTTWATHQRTTARRRVGAFRALADALLPVTVHAAVVSTGPGEVHVVHRRHWFTTGRKPVHSVAHTVVHTPNVTAVDIVDSSRYLQVRVARIISGRSVVRIPFPEAAESGTVLQAVLGVHAPR